MTAHFDHRDAQEAASAQAAASFTALRALHELLKAVPAGERTRQTDWNRFLTASLRAQAEYAQRCRALLSQPTPAEE